MAIVLGGVTLSPNMMWTDRYQHSPVVQDTRITLGGTLVVHSNVLSSGRPITLEALSDQGWLTKAQVEAVQLIADVSGATYTLTIGSESYNVMFRHHEGDAVSMTPLITRATPLDGDYFVGTIKLMTV